MNTTAISPCPNPECGKECIIEIGHHTGYWIMCRECEYCGPIVTPAMARGIEGANASRAGVHEAIRLHNLICERRPSQQEAPVAISNPGVCYVCGAPAFCSVNVAPGAASGGTMKPVCDKHNPFAHPPVMADAEVAIREIAAAQYAYAHHNWDWKAVVIGISDGAHIEFAAAREMRGRNHES